MVYLWEVQEALKRETATLKNQIWAASNGQPIPGYISVEACRFALVIRGEGPEGYHNS